MAMSKDELFFLLLAAFLVMLSGLFSGLNLGLMSFTPDDLTIVIKGSEDKAAVKNAKRILPVRQRGNLLLCTLLLGNTLVNAMIAILLADLASGLVGGLVTTGLIVVFGEIIPQSVCSRHALAIGARSIPIVWVFLLVCFPIAYPIACLLDCLLGREVGALYTRRELGELIKLNVSDPERQKQTGITSSDGRLLSGAIQYKDKRIEELMTPIEHVFSLSMDHKLDKDTYIEMLQRGHTRIPVYEDDERRKFVTLLYCKDLLGVGFEREIVVRDVVKAFDDQRCEFVPSSTTAGAAFEKCMKQHKHLLLVTKDVRSAGCGAKPSDAEMEGDGEAGADRFLRLDPGGPEEPRVFPMEDVVGIVTMEDIIEEIIQAEIVGEGDEFVSNTHSRLNVTRHNPCKLLKSFDRPDPLAVDPLNPLDDGGRLPGEPDDVAS